MIINVLWGHLLCGIIFFWYIMGKAASASSVKVTLKTAITVAPFFDLLSLLFTTLFI